MDFKDFRKIIELEKKKRREKELKELRMRCDICYLSDFNEVLILKSNRFSKYASKKEAKARRVCWGCAKRLFSQMKYNFGTHWRNLFFQDSRILDKNKEKYMVIHI